MRRAHPNQEATSDNGYKPHKALHWHTTRTPRMIANPGSHHHRPRRHSFTTTNNNNNTLNNTGNNNSQATKPTSSSRAKSSKMNRSDYIFHSQRSDSIDPGCAPPERMFASSPDLFARRGASIMDDDDDVTVVHDNLDRRPSLIGNQEKLRRLSSVSQEQRDARDRQLIEMYTRRGSKSSKSLSRPPLSPTKDRRRPGKCTPNRSGSNCSTSSTGSTQSCPENFYPYYDLVVVETNHVAAAVSGETASVILPPTYSQTL